MEPLRKVDPLEGRLAVSAEIRALMGRYRVTQTSLAKTLGMSQSALSERLSGSVPWSVDDLIRVAARFGVDPGALVASIPPRILVMGTSAMYLQDCSDLRLFEPDVRIDSAVLPRSLELVKA